MSAKADFLKAIHQKDETAAIDALRKHNLDPNVSETVTIPARVSLKDMYKEMGVEIPADAREAAELDQGRPEFTAEIPALSLALRSQMDGLANELIARGADVNAGGNDAPIFNARDAASVRLLASFGADLNAQTTREMGTFAAGATALHFAAARPSGFNMVSALLAAGADPNIKLKTRLAQTPLHSAIRTDSQSVQALVRHGADVTLPGADGTPLGVTIASRHPEIAAEMQQIAIDQAANQQALNSDAKSPGSMASDAQSAPASPESDDPLYGQAVSFVRGTGRASMSAVQRELRIGYNRTARLFEQMEKNGVVGPAEPSGRRAVLSPKTPSNDMTASPPEESKDATLGGALDSAHEVNSKPSLEKSVSETPVDASAELAARHSVSGDVRFDNAVMDNLARSRARDSAAALEAAGLNEIKRERQNADKSHAQNDGASTPDRRVRVDEEREKTIPDAVKKRFLQVGDKFYHPRDTSSVAFEDKGSKLVTRSSSESMVESLIAIAEARGWTEINASGDEAFRKRVWMAGAERGMRVSGYKPTELEKAELAKRLEGIAPNAIQQGGDARASRQQTSGAATNNDSARPAAAAAEGKDVTVGTAQPGDASTPASATSEKKSGDISGKIQAHGSAPYKHDAKNEESYFVAVTNEEGAEVTAWGVDLPRALEESGAMVGDDVTLTRTGRKAVTVQEPIKDEAGNVVGHQEKEVVRNTWHVARAEAFDSAPPESAVRAHPELAGSYAVVAAIGKKAEQDGLTPQQRAVVEARVRENVSAALRRGEQPQMNKIEKVEKVRAHEPSPSAAPDRSQEMGM